AAPRGERQGAPAGGGRDAAAEEDEAVDVAADLVGAELVGGARRPEPRDGVARAATATSRSREKSACRRARSRAGPSRDRATAGTPGRAFPRRSTVRRSRPAA